MFSEIYNQVEIEKRKESRQVFKLFYQNMEWEGDFNTCHFLCNHEERWLTILMFSHYHQDPEPFQVCHHIAVLSESYLGEKVVSGKGYEAKKEGWKEKGIFN